MKNKPRGSWQTREGGRLRERPGRTKQEATKRDRAFTHHENVIDRDETEKIWSQFVALAADVSKRWEGASAVDEIRTLRGRR